MAEKLFSGGSLVAGEGEFSAGEAGLLLSALYRPVADTRYAGRVLCVPRLGDGRTDPQLCALSGADLVLRADVAGGGRNFEAFVDSISSAAFVLCGCLPAAVVAAAYGVPFAFWDDADSGLSPELRRFAGELGLAATAATNGVAGRKLHGAQARPFAWPPLPWRALASAPWPLRPEALERILAHLDRPGSAGKDRLAAAIRSFARGRRAPETPADAPRAGFAYEDALSQAEQRIARTTSHYEDALSRAEQRIAGMTAVGDRFVKELWSANSHPWRPLWRGVQRTALRFVLLFRPALPKRSRDSLRRSLDKRRSARFQREWDIACGRLEHWPVPHPDVSGQKAPPPAVVARLPLRLQSAAEPVVSIIIPTYGQVDYTIGCVASLAAHPPAAPFEVIVMDDAYPGDDAARLQGAFEGVRVIRNAANKGFLLTCNAAARESRGKYLFFLNNDTELQPGAIDALVNVLEGDDTVGMAGSKLIYPDGSLQEAGGIIWSDGSAWNYGRGGDPSKPEYNYRREADYISGAAIMVRTALFEALGGFDEAYVPAYCEDSDLAFRIREAGLRVVYEPRSVVVHFEGKSHGTDVGSGIKAYQVANTERLRERWKAILQRDHMADPKDVLRARDRARHRPVILVVDHYVPEPDKDAGSRTIMAFLQALCSEGWVVKFWPQNRVYSPEYTPPLQDLGIEVIDSRWRGSFETWIALNGHALDHVLVSRPNVAMDVIGPLVSNTFARLSYYGHDLHFLRMRRQAEVTGDAVLLEDSKQMEARERNLWRRFDNVIYPSVLETDVVAAESSSIRARTIVPYFFETFEPREAPPEGSTVLFVAGFAHPPNIDAAKFLVQEVMPLVWAKMPHVHLQLVGSHPSAEVRALAGRHVEVTGWVSAEQLRSHYLAARVAIIPLRFGSGIKSKTVEAMSIGLPLVTTSIGAEGLQGLGDICPIDDDPGQLAAGILHLMGDDAAWLEQSRRQVRYAEAHFSLHALSESLLSALDEKREEHSSPR
ncbi:glycosyltransferase [Xanthobacter sediminis]|uniref:glycosyltransferase n=1 Tax=Xanthobacter sediminis TaxID=3119926 RepID=UPI00372CC87F